jgi:hypothetical protein
LLLSLLLCSLLSFQAWEQDFKDRVIPGYAKWHGREPPVADAKAAH